MATLVLAAAGKAVGGVLGLGGIGGVIGKAAGSLAGNLIDQSLFGGGASRNVEGARLADFSVQSSSEGASLPRVYGRVRLAGQLIWATSFEEVITTEEQGGKAGGNRRTSTVTTYSYFANFAVGLCSGKIARIGRIWADGKVLDTRQIVMRVYNGSEDQMPDPLISAHQTAAPAYRGTAYVVFERLALEQFGNRLPQLSFEVIRPVEPLETQVRAITIIPGAGEFAYSPTVVSEVLGPGEQRSINRHVVAAESDWRESIDELQALCPNLKRVALVVSWFGDDLRAGQCTVRPKVEANGTVTEGATWSVAGLNRADADEVSRIDGRPAYGGTPSDDTVIAAIQDLKSRGLEVLLYPFIMMDVPAGNGLPDPHGGAEQAPYPWRGRIVTSGTVGADVASFVGTATAAHFSVSGGSISYTGPAEWSFRRHILHCAALSKAAGGVESILVGSELRGLTRSHAGGGSYPFADALRALAADVRALVGSDTKISYAADWSEYGAHQVSGTELRFPLDTVWSSPDVDFIGIDNYLPLTDVRDGGDPDGGVNPYDLKDSRAGVQGGEYYDWYYASEADRTSGHRTAITDGAHNKPWVYRTKDLWGFWQNLHYERVGGTEVASPTAWVPQSKPIRMTELGFPAVDRGANQPNVFVDPKSSESAVPHFSRGFRDDVSQRRALEASLSWWSDSHPEVAAGDNPVSAVYGGPMVDPDGIYLWTWDARPFPAFPMFSDVWADGGNWRLGHWLSGRLGGISIQGLCKAVLADYGISDADVKVTGLGGSLDGYLLSGPVSARDVLEPVLTAFSGLASDRRTHVELSSIPPEAVVSLNAADLAEPGEEEPLLSRTRAQANELSAEIRLGADDPVSDFRRRIAASRRLEGGSQQVETQTLPASSMTEPLHIAADRRLYRIWSERERVTFAVGPDRIGLEPGDVVAINGTPTTTFDPPLMVRVTAIEDAGLRRIEAVRVAADLSPAANASDKPGTVFQNSDLSPAHAVFLDLPKLIESDPDDAVRLAARAKPWPGVLSVMRSASGSGFAPVMTLDAPAVMGKLTAPLSAGPLWVFDRANTMTVELYEGQLQSRSETDVLAGANALAVRCQNGGWEVLQFQTAELTGTNTYRLSTLLRAQRGTEPEMLSGAASGADVVFLSEDRVPLVPLSAEQSGLGLNYRLVPQGRALDDPAVVALLHTSTQRAAKPLAPVHLKARRTVGGVLVSWIRQTREGGVSWEQSEVPLGEDLEAYEVDILSPGDAVLRTVTSGTSEVLYSSADELLDFGSPVTSLNVAVAQLSRRVGRGFERKATCHV
ncbi:glycoside hydrolase/phage tail family protein [Labrenzia sp. PHM005]|uniref:baseplate multidomain protein megatron n=1 Tax=Labrenzia sp. PHM005 TaxID=2590016 RepID=UPI00113FFD8B|nr:glycoside hydrolase/phage tail family protein [Labrenzia sp. PHM005]QDG78415.1 hypothetical protein FJ695_22540 [Labrenzia sp. PHM005]